MQLPAYNAIVLLIHMVQVLTLLHFVKCLVCPVIMGLCQAGLSCVDTLHMQHMHTHNTHTHTQTHT